MGKFREFVPIAISVVIIALCALVPFAVGRGNDGVGQVRATAVALAAINMEGQILQGRAQLDQQALTDAIVVAAKDGVPLTDIAKAIAPLLSIPEDNALQGVQSLIAQAAATDLGGVPTP
ncbi:MAG: hypothetical protein EXQ74_01710 [Thermoleophilia bacterium]|nr:hypothetical protein [Thermoleophilia bacterium]